jgi:hypothetical protein
MLAAVESKTSEAEPRRLSAWLLLGILSVGPVFVWLTLRRGYSRDLRIGAFLYALCSRR